MSDFVTLGDYITIQKGKAPLATDYSGPAAKPYLNPEYLRGRSSAVLAKPGPDAVHACEGDTILLWDGSNAGEFFKAKSGLAASTMAKITPDARFKTGYFFHVAKHAETYLKNQTNGTGIPHVDRELLEAIRVFCPAPAEQLRLAEILDHLDTAIHETEAIIAKLKAVKQGLLHDLLTRGIDANGELRPPQAEAPHLYKQSALGWIPLEWEVKPLYEVGQAVTGTTPPSVDPLAWGSGTPFITPSEIADDRPIADSERQVSARGLRYVRLLPAKTIVIVCIGSTIGKVGITDIASCTNQQINAVLPCEGIHPDYLFSAIRMHIDQLRGLAGLQAVPIVNKKSFESIYVPVARLSEQIEIAKRLDALNTRIFDEDKTLHKLRLEKTGLLDDLLTGRVRVTPLLEGVTP